MITANVEVNVEIVSTDFAMDAMLTTARYVTSAFVYQAAIGKTVMHAMAVAPVYTNVLLVNYVGAVVYV
jgi:hypothetical protein